MENKDLKFITLANIGAKQIPTIGDDIPIISIVGRYDTRPTIPNLQNRKILSVCFDVVDDEQHPGYITKETLSNILNFIKEVATTDHDEIYVHCTEGRIRSYTLCESLVYNYYSEEVDTFVGACLNFDSTRSSSRGSSNRVIHRAIHTYLESMFYKE